MKKANLPLKSSLRIKPTVVGWCNRKHKSSTSLFYGRRPTIGQESLEDVRRFELNDLRGVYRVEYPAVE